MNARHTEATAHTDGDMLLLLLSHSLHLNFCGVNGGEISFVVRSL